MAAKKAANDATEAAVQEKGQGTTTAPIPATSEAVIAFPHIKVNQTHTYFGLPDGWTASLEYVGTREIEAAQKIQSTLRASEVALAVERRERDQGRIILTSRDGQSLHLSADQWDNFASWVADLYSKIQDGGDTLGS